MINANELRVGNWLLDKEESPIKVLAISYEVVKVLDRNGVLFQDAEPVKLTPEILEKCGFMKDYSGFALPDKMSLSFSVTKGGEFFPCWKDKALHIDTTKHLHQLQNLYFALTNEELKINL